MKKAARFAALALGIALVGCQEEQSGATTADFETQRAAAQARGAAQAKNAKPAKGGNKSAPAQAPDARTNYGGGVMAQRYDATGLRDPFRSFVKEELHADAMDVQSPLEQFELGQLSISGVVWQADRRRALVLDPSGQAYVVKTGDRMGKNDGVVTEIGDSSVVVLESYVDFHGDKTEKEIEMRIRQSTGG
jgi:Tfp pilus assembly protein PilP